MELSWKIRPKFMGILTVLVGVLAVGLWPTGEIASGNAHQVQYRTAVPDSSFDGSRWLWLTYNVRSDAPLAAVIRAIIPVTNQVPGNDMEEASRDAAVSTAAAVAEHLVSGRPIEQGWIAVSPLGDMAVPEIQSGDILVAVDGQPGNPEQAVRQSRGPVDLTLVRDGTRTTVTVTPPRYASGLAGLGWFLESAAVPVTSRPIDTEGSSGGSAGLLYTLANVDASTDGDLTGGRVIAATGMITIDGSASIIGGVMEKMTAALDAGAEVIFVATGNYDEAATIVDDRATLVSVTSAVDAVTWLCANGGQSSVCDDMVD